MFVRDEASGEDTYRRITFGSDTLQVTCTDYGATMTSVMYDGAEMTLSYDTIAEYQTSRYFGATVGRYGNRISKGKFTLSGKEFTLATNNGENHLHGGCKGFNTLLWGYSLIDTDTEKGVAFTRLSPDGEEGYPGNLTATVRYTVVHGSTLRMVFQASSDCLTPCNMVNHNYWNLAGWQGGAKILDHTLSLQCPFYIEVGPGSIPTGQIVAVAGTAMDFYSFPEGKRIGQRLGEGPTAGPPAGYDHCFVVKGESGALRNVAVLTDPLSKRTMRMRATYPGVQVYTSNFLVEGSKGKGGTNYGQYSAVCLEAEYFPDSVNNSHFPSCVIGQGKVFNEEVELTFSKA